MSTTVEIIGGIAAGLIGTGLCWLIWKAIEVIANAEGCK